MSEDNDLIKRFDNLERRLDSISYASVLPDCSANFGRSDQIDLRELWDVIWQGKWLVLGITFLFSIIGALYALSLPNVYKSEGFYAPARSNGGNAISGQLGGLAAIAGINLSGDKNNDIDQAVLLINSWPFLEKVISSHDLKPLIMGVKGWNRTTGELIWNLKVYDPVNRIWVREPSLGRESEPSSYEAYQEFKKMITAKFDTKASLLSVSVEYYSPDIARDWVNLLIKNINENFRSRDVDEAGKNITYLEKKVSETSVAHMQAVLFNIIESQMKTLMLAEVDSEYLVKQVVRPMISERPNSPRRTILVLLFTILGGVFSFVFIFFRFIRSRGVS